MTDIHTKTPSEIAAQIWCEPKHAGVTMDVAFAQTIADRIAAEQAHTDRWFETAQQHCRNEEYYRGLIIKIGELFGVEARTSDDGSIQQDVLCAKVPELVAAALASK